MKKIINNLIILILLIILLIIFNLFIINRKNLKIDSFDEKKEDYYRIESENTINEKYISLKKELGRIVGYEKTSINENIIQIIEKYEKNKDGTILSLEYIDNGFKQDEIKKDNIRIVTYGSLEKISDLSEEMDKFLINSKVTKVIVDNVGTTFRGEIEIVSYE